jgi:hypothetical protein
MGQDTAVASEGHQQGPSEAFRADVDEGTGVRVFSFQKEPHGDFRVLDLRCRYIFFTVTSHQKGQGRSGKQW